MKLSMLSNSTLHLQLLAEGVGRLPAKGKKKCFYDEGKMNRYRVKVNTSKVSKDDFSLSDITGNHSSHSNYYMGSTPPIGE